MKFEMTKTPKTNFQWRLLAALLPLLALGCASATSPQGSLKALKDLVQLKEEVKRLRNQVEEMQYDAETTLRRERNLLDDLDRRLLALERAQRLAGGEVLGDDGELAEDGEDPGADPAGRDQAAAAPDDAQSEPEEAALTSLEEQQAYDRALALLKQSRFAEAISGFQKLADAWPSGQLADDAYFMKAKAHQFSRENRDALASFERVVSRYPNSDRAPEALLGMGDIHFDIGAYPRAAEIYREVLRRFPVHKVATSAETRLRRITQNIEQTQ